MLISRKHNFAFVHVPKTGGDSVSAALAPFADINGSQGRSKHWPARRVRKEYFEGRTWGDCVSFGTVRNPWEQVHSDYWFCRQSPVPSESLGSWRDKVVRCKEIGFAEFVVDICGEHGRSGRGLFGHYLADRCGNQMVSHILRHEQLANEWPRLCQRIGIPEVELPRKNVTRGRPDYREGYDDKSQFLVGRKFAVDIERFGYSFD